MSMGFNREKTLEEQRFDRLKETVAEYLDDEDGSSTKFLDDLQRALLENSQYFAGRVDAYAHVQEFFK